MIYTIYGNIMIYSFVLGREVLKFSNTIQYIGLVNLYRRNNIRYIIIAIQYYIYCD